MTSVDRAAMGWSIAIVAVAVAVAIAAAGSTGISIDSGSPAASAPAMQETTQEMVLTKSKIPGYDRLTSIIDLGMGHDQHQLAIILPPSDKVYSGTLRYDASELIQLVSLVGPLGSGEDNGQPIWTPDGTTKFALTLVDPKNSNGKWDFVGNALAVHTMNTNPFIVDYRVTFDESPESDSVMTGTVESIPDPGVGHEFHSLAIIIPPSEDVFTGTLSYSASEPIQLVSLKGPLGPGETAPMIWTPDGSTNFALTFVETNDQMGVWEFSGNALATHTMNRDGFTVSYAVSLEKTSGMTTTSAASTGPTTVEVSMPTGTSVPGCEETDVCYIPSSVSISTGSTVVWMNDDTVAHTVTSGGPAGGPDGVFDSSLVMGGASFEVTFDDAGSYDYFCMVHPWMTGTINVS